MAGICMILTADVTAVTALFFDNNPLGCKTDGISLELSLFHFVVREMKHIILPKKSCSS
jgi:hypothetical protein